MHQQHPNAGWKTRYATLFVCGMCLLTGWANRSEADVVKMHTGGEIRGVVEAPDKDQRLTDVSVNTVYGSVIQVAHADVELIVPRKPVIEDYETQARVTPATAAAQLELALWCRGKRLREQADEHFENVVVLDPENKIAHRALDHILRDGKWHDRTEYMENRGFVKHKGKWITLQERDLAVKSQLERDSERKWYRRIHQLHGWLTGRYVARQRDAQKELMQLDDANAIPALVKHFQDEKNARLRDFHVTLLKRIGGAGSVAPLIRQGLYDVDKTIRRKALDSIPSDFELQAIGLLVSELRSQSNVVIQRAAAALSDYDSEVAVAPLISALVTSHRYQVRVADNSGTVSFGSDGSFSMGSGGRTGLTPELEMALRSGQYPHGVIVVPPNSPRRTRVVTVKVDHTNNEVLNTLKKLTGQDFGFNVRAWKLWHTAIKNGGGEAVAMP